MNKRIRIKQEKIKNIRRINYIISYIGKKLTITNIKYGDGYFFSYHGKNSVCHFYIKETPNWKYGIWLLDDKFEIFGEHDECIDKFKPSRTYLSDYECDLNAFIEDVFKISNSPKMYFIDSYSGNVFDDFSNKKITQEQYIENEYNEFLEWKEREFNNDVYDKNLVFGHLRSLVQHYDEIIAIGIYDKNKDGWIHSPRYNVRVVLNTDKYSVDYLYLFADRIEEKELDNNYINYDIGKRTHEHQIHFNGYFSSGYDLRKADFILK